MQAHTGLPKNIPQRRNKAKIFSPNVSPSRNVTSPAKTDQEDLSNCKTPRKSSPSSESKHRLKSKQKPDLNPPAGAKNKNKLSSVTTKQFDHRQDRQTEASKPQQTEFVQSVLGMMGKLTKKAQQNSKDLRINDSQQKLPQLSNKPAQKNGSLIYRQRPIQAGGHGSDEKLLARCTLMLGDSSNWLNYCGQHKQNMRTGYGILYFKNEDKFMGGFKQNKANGHGTYYFHDLGQRVMAIWSNNQIMLSSGYMIEKL